MTIEEIAKPVEKYIKEFDEYFSSLLKSDVALLELIIKYVSRKKGKRVRPLVVILAAQLCGGISKRTYTGAALAEFLHTATLIHDDVVDEADKRRGLATINALWDNKTAVLVGDFFLGVGLLTALDTNEYNFLQATSIAVERMSEGELLQMQNSKSFNYDEEMYFKIISGKTASLLATSAEIGAMSATEDREVWKSLRSYGENAGIAFQIKDDLMDFKSTSKIIGKPVGNDLKEKKITLPLLYSLNKVKKKEAKEILKIIKNGSLSKKDIHYIIDFIEDKGGFEYAENKAIEYSKKSIQCLEKFDDSEAKNSLINFANFVLTRNN